MADTIEKDSAVHGEHIEATDGAATMSDVDQAVRHDDDGKVTLKTKLAVFVSYATLSDIANRVECIL